MASATERLQKARVMADKGNPRCDLCGGRGGYCDAHGWHKCTCVTPTRTVQQIIRKANARTDRPWRSPFTK